jgi:hypothetical protein
MGDEGSGRTRWTDERIDDRFREIDNFREAVSRLPDSMARLAVIVDGLSAGGADVRRYIHDVEDRVTGRIDRMDEKWDEREEARQGRQAEDDRAAKQRRLMVGLAALGGVITILATVISALLGLFGHG